MLHIVNKTEYTHKNAFAVDVFIALMLFSVFHVSVTQASDITAENVINLVNKARSSVDVAVLEKNKMLQKAAEQKAQDMIDHDYFAHVSPAGKTPWDFIENAGYDYKFAGENLAINFTDAVDQQQAWMNSELHRKNILNPGYKEIGVAVKEGMIDGNMTTVTVQEFGSQMPKEVATVVKDVAPLPVSQPKASVAGSEAAYSPQTPKITPATISSSIDVKTFFKNNPVTMIGWLSAFGVAILIVLIDVAALIHKKHEQLLILHDSRNRFV